ncbi:hypothetical protein, partial [Shewanella sp.]|uniref:hypothetical protein n=1 Tax=Shewanella sp. TaxID=50422 RepID=UPI00404839F2
GGVKNLYILSGSVSSITNASEGLINAMTGSGEFFKFELFRQTSDYTETITSTPENGTIFYEQSVNAIFFKLQSATRNQMKVLAQNPNLKVIVETNNGSTDGVGKYFYLGQENGLQLTGGTGATGTAFGDLNGYTLNFVGQEPAPASEISGSDLSVIMSGIIVGA